jgi:predicted ATP-grasp superfamily ATP-dependent carboligase
MRLGWFDTIDPIPELKNPHVLVVIPSWLNAGESAAMALNVLEESSHAEHLASLVRPGEFLDFTRYRPTTLMKEGTFKFEIPNAIAAYGKVKDSDFIFLRLPEPHMRSEQYIDSVLELLKYFKVKRYCLLGSVYEMLPHTRPPLITGQASNLVLQNTIEAAKVLPSQYEGPTSILNLIGQEVKKLGIETMSLVVHVPGYFQLSADHRGETHLLEVLKALYDTPIPREDIEHAREETEQMETAAETFLQVNPQLRQMLTQLENNYDARVNSREQIRLSPEVEEFLQNMNQRFEAD